MTCPVVSQEAFPDARNKIVFAIFRLADALEKDFSKTCCSRF
jgi:hypothetical protein